MTDRGLIARCPGCGKGKEIAMALGQLLQCEICRTVFHAPIAADGETDSDALSDSFVVQPGGVTQEPPDAGPRSAFVDSTSGGARFLGNETNPTRTRSWRAHDLAISSTQEPTDHSEKGMIPVESAGQPETEDVVNDANTPAIRWIAMAVFAVGVASIAGVIVAFFLTRSPSPSDSGKTVAAASLNQQGGAVHWTDAAKYRQRKHPVTLHVEQVKYGSLRAKDSSNQVVHTQDDNLLGITIGVHNRGTRPRAFKNWYGHAFETDQGGTIVAELTDNHDRAYSLLKFDDVRRIEGQSYTDSIGPKDTAQDTVVFMIPEAMDRSRIKYFRLKLPGAAVGLSEYFRFQIPTGMIEGFEDT
ncbi:MAG: PHD finger domain-containing protein [Planctomycetota bacterium]